LSTDSTTMSNRPYWPSVAAHSTRQVTAADTGRADSLGAAAQPVEPVERGGAGGG
jgi:hypothetical protein